MVVQHRRIGPVGIGVLLLLLIGAAVAFAVSAWSGIGQPSNAIGGPFTLTAAGGQRLTDQAFRGKWMLVYFGYSSCPDVCPTTLAEIAETLDRLGPLSARLQPLFITVDPERDTPEVIDAYVKAFDARIVGLAGTAAEIRQVAKAYRVHYARKDAPDGNRRAYLMEHSAFVYLMGPDGTYVTLFAPGRGQGPDEMASLIREHLARSSSR
jgi:cytochrome oxidase Cu insertion factor (SCO1/SenC/PrrC family)